MSCKATDPALPAANFTSHIDVGPNVEHIGLSDFAERFEWLPCHERPLLDASVRFPNRHTWRDPPSHKLCCSAGTCFRAVLDDRIAIPPRKFSVNQKVRVRNYAAKRGDSGGWELGRVTSINPLRVASTTQYSRECLPAPLCRRGEQRGLDHMDTMEINKIVGACVGAAVTSVQVCGLVELSQ